MITPHCENEQVLLFENYVEAFSKCQVLNYVFYPI